jgi:hypothetical protein
MMYLKNSNFATARLYYTSFIYIILLGHIGDSQIINNLDPIKYKIEDKKCIVKFSYLDSLYNFTDDGIKESLKTISSTFKRTIHWKKNFDNP